MDCLEWLQLASETDNDFELFEIYRLLGPGRTVQGVAVEAISNGAALDFVALRGLSASFRWRQRALAFDRWRVGQVSNGLRNAFQDRQGQRVDIFKQVTKHTRQAVAVLVSIMNDDKVGPTSRIKAANTVVAMSGYVPPEVLAEAAQVVDAETKAKMLAALTPDERDTLAALTSKMRTAVGDQGTT